MSPSPDTVARAILQAIYARQVLQVFYQHTTDKQIVQHKIAPFDIGTSNPKTASRNKDNVYAYCYDHLDRDGLPDPKVVAFNIDSFLEIRPTSEYFDPTDLARRHLERTGFDYRSYRFAVAQDRDWFA